GSEGVGALAPQDGAADGARAAGRSTEGPDDPGALAFHAGTARDGGRWLTAGGRVVGLTALGADLEAARRAAYRAVETVSFEGAHYRRDVGRGTTPPPPAPARAAAATTSAGPAPRARPPLAPPSAG